MAINLDHLMDWGLQNHNAGRLEEAKSAYSQVLSVDPRHAHALHLLGLALTQAGNPAEGEHYLRAAARQQPSNWTFQANLAMALSNAGNWAEALPAFKRALRLKPGEAQLEMGHANCLAMQGRLTEAEQQLRRVTQRHPQFALAWFNFGNTLKEQRKFAEARSAYERALALQPELLDARLNLGTVLHSLEQLSEASTAYETVIASEPRHLLAHCNLASLRIDEVRLAESEAICRRALVWAPHSAELHSTLSRAVAFQGRAREAVAPKREAVRLEPEKARYVAALGIALTELGELDEGLALLDRAHEIEPTDIEILNMRASAFLAVGRFREGWTAYTQRWVRQRFEEKYRGLELVQTLPSSLAGVQLNVIREQGIGDEIFFLRYAPVLTAAGAHISFTASTKIASVLQRVPCLDQVRTKPPTAGLTMMVGTLPYAMMEREGGASEPVPVPPLGLTALPERIAAMRERLQRLGPPPYVALTWRAGTSMSEQKGNLWALSKEVPLNEFATGIESAEATFIAVQRAPRSGEITELAERIGRPVHDLCLLNDQLEDMMALLALVDEYVAVSNTNVHLRAGLDRVARVLVPFPAEWRWMARGAESPWFPGFALYRQTSDGSWSETMAQLKSDLASSCAKR